jgi:hypothetical protein
MSVRQTVLLVAAFVVAVGVGVGVSASVDEGTTTRELPRTGEPIPVLAPVDGPVDDPIDATEPPPDSGGGGTGGGGGASGDGSAAGGSAATTAPDVPTVAEYDIDGGLPALRFLDPCATGGGSACDGVASTVLGSFAPRPFEIRAVYGGACHPPGDAERMPIGFPITIYSSNPADFELTLTGRDDPSVVRTARTSTGAASIADWDSSGGRSLIPTCAGVLLPNRTAEYDVVVTGTSGAETATVTATLIHEATGGRPPVQVIRPFIPDEDELRVVVPAKGAPMGGVSVRLFAENGFGLARSCLTGGRSPRAVETTPLPDAELDAAEYPFDLVWDHRYEHTFDTGDFSPGLPYYLCIFWYDGDGGVEERQAFAITPPNRYRVTLQVTAIHFTDHRGIPSQYDVRTLGGRCRVQLIGDEPVSSVGFEPEPGESVTAFFDMHGPPGSCNHEDPLATMPGTTYTLPEFDRMLRVDVSRDGVGSTGAYLRLPLSSCAPSGACSVGTGATHRFDRSFEVALPERAGTVTIRARFSEQDRAGHRFWEIGAPTTFS